MPALLAPQPHTRLTLQEAAASRRVGYSTLRKRVSDGTLPAERVGRRVFVRPEDVDAMAVPVLGRPTLDRTIESAVARVVEAAPRLTIHQRERLAVVIGGAS